MIKQFLRIMKEVLLDAVYGITYFVGSNLRFFADILSIICPYIMYFMGQYVFGYRGKFGVGGELFLPLVFAAVIYIIRQFANKIGKGSSIPVPRKRFTEVDDDGEVSVDQSRLQELILYVADVEDWLERHGLL